jgi:hypothetical protein
MRRDGVAGLEDEGDIRLPVFVQGSRHADDHRSHFLDPGEISGGTEPFRRNLFLDDGGLNVLDVTAPLIDGFHLGRVNVQPQHPHAGLGKLQR